MLEGQSRAARVCRLLRPPARPGALERRGVLQRRLLGGRSGSRPLRLRERACTRSSSVTLRSWLRRLLLSQQRGGQERLLGVSSPARLSAAGCWRPRREVSACGSVASHRSRQRPLCLFSHSLLILGPGLLPQESAKEKGFPDHPSCFHRGSSWHEGTLAHSHTLIYSLT